jgi:uncharacterized protein YjbI with pentapeptide repeats
MVGANLRGANLENADLRNADLIHARIDAGTRWRNADTRGCKACPTARR